MKMDVEPKIGGFYPQNGWFISWKTLLKWMIWGVFPLFSETPRSVGFFVLGISYELSRSAIDYGTGIRSLKSTQSWDFVIDGYFLKLNKPW